MLSIKDCVNVETNSLSKYVQTSREKALSAVCLERILKKSDGKDKSTLIEDKKQRLFAKSLHRLFHRSIEEEGDQRSWDWLKKRWLKKETEGLQIATRNQALRTNSVKHVIDKQDVSPVCRMCEETDETVGHTTAECKMVVQKCYEDWRHDKVVQVPHWYLCGNPGT